MTDLEKITFKIDFIGIGVPKCGTEWIVKCLREHPEIDFSVHKEINYFLSKTEGITNFVYDNVRLKNIDDYAGQFDWESVNIKGEYSNHYIFDDQALIKVKNTFPQVKLIIAIRHPADYLYSIYWYLKYSNAYHIIPDTFEEALENAGRDDLYDKSHAEFGKLINQLYKLFGKDNLHVIYLDDIKSNPLETYQDLYDYLGVTNDFQPNFTDVKVNPTTSIRFPLVMRITNGILKLLSKIGLRFVINYMLNTDNFIKKLYKSTMHTDKKYPPMDPVTRKKLINYYKEDIKLLSSVTNRNLDDWIKN